MGRARRSLNHMFALAFAGALAFPSGAVGQTASASLLGLPTSRVLESDFFRFFGFSLQDEADNWKTFAPGGPMGSSVELVARLGRSDRVGSLTLTVGRGLLEEPGTRPFARDLVGSFITSTAPRTNAGEAEAIGAWIKEGSRGAVSALLPEADPSIAVLAVVDGESQRATLGWSGVHVLVENTGGSEARLHIVASLSPPGGPSPLSAHATPSSVVRAIISAADRSDPDGLAGLCDPRGENDGDSKRICDMNRSSHDWSEFVELLRGAVVGETEVSGASARVLVAFGADRGGEETFELVLRDGLWYLSGL